MARQATPNLRIPALKEKKPRVIKTDVLLPEGSVAVYAGVHIARALSEVTADMSLYKGVRLAELLGAVYVQGKKDGARYAREELDKVWDQIPHRNPGKPRKR